ncbi:MAG: Mu-like prophage major head subunit gpT family protein [Pseudomonadota bacterium]
MQINTANLEELRKTFKRDFDGALSAASPEWSKIATKVTSSTSQNIYGWLGKVPGMREWIGPRQLNAIMEHDYTLKNKPYESTVAVDRDDIEDDNLGTYSPLMREMAEGSETHVDELVFGSLKAGNQEECYDGQAFFDTDQPVILADGSMGTISNYAGGANSFWCLMSTQRQIKPIIYQSRREAEFQAMDDPTNPHTFNNKEFVYGTDARRASGYGFWQMAYGSRQELNSVNYWAARSAIRSQKGDHGRPLGIRPNLLVVSPDLEERAREILVAERDAAGATNTARNTAELMVTEWLA